jgi:hypothetical protein
MWAMQRLPCPREFPFDFGLRVLHESGVNEIFYVMNGIGILVSID